MRLKKADNAVLPGVQLVASALDSGVLKIHPRCANLIEEMENYAWDARSQERGEDRPLKKDDHAADALRYAMMHYRRELRRLISQGKDESQRA